MYIRGAGVELRNPTRTGIEVFLAGVIYDITHPLDYNDLIASGDFIDVTPSDTEVLETQSEVTEDDDVNEATPGRNRKGNK